MRSDPNADWFLYGQQMQQNKRPRLELGNEGQINGHTAQVRDDNVKTQMELDPSTGQLSLQELQNLVLQVKAA